MDDAKSISRVQRRRPRKNKYVGVLGVLIVGSFIIPMLQYFGVSLRLYKPLNLMYPNSTLASLAHQT